MRNLALFDFDGTLTTKDTFIEFIRYYHGDAKWLMGFAILSPVLVAFKLKLMANWKAKETVIKYFFGGKRIIDVEAAALRFTDEKLPAIMRSEALARFQRHLAEGDDVIVVSASAQSWVKPWADKMGVRLLATLLETENGIVTGKLSGKNCYGPEKVARIKSEFRLEEYDNIYAYGDSSGDTEMLAIATKPYYRKFD